MSSTLIVGVPASRTPEGVWVSTLRVLLVRWGVSGIGARCPSGISICSVSSLSWSIVFSTNFSISILRPSTLFLWYRDMFLWDGMCAGIPRGLEVRVGGTLRFWSAAGAVADRASWLAGTGLCLALWLSFLLDFNLCLIAANWSPGPKDLDRRWSLDFFFCFLSCLWALCRTISASSVCVQASTLKVLDRINSGDGHWPFR